MDIFPQLILFIYGAIGMIVLLILVYLVIQRIREKDREDFEKREN